MTTANGLLPSLLSGNGVVIKPSPRTPTSAHWWAREAAETGMFPDGLIGSALCSHDDFAATVLASQNVGRLTATGSVGTGRALYSAAAAASGTEGASRFLGVGLELGGKDAMYVAADADVEAAAAAAVDGSCYNAGQSCCAVERVFVHESIYEKFLEKAAQEMEGYILGDPMSETTTMVRALFALHSSL
jgi:acyl-CoA reductase-like NAD-dependent aldehyde dehydrogenase